MHLSKQANAGSNAKGVGGRLTSGNKVVWWQVPCFIDAPGEFDRLGKVAVWVGRCGEDGPVDAAKADKAQAQLASKGAKGCFEVGSRVSF